MQLELVQILGKNITVAMNDTGAYSVSAVDWQTLTNELQQLFFKHRVIRWVGFIELQPRDNELVLIKDLDTGQVTEQRWKVDHDYPPFQLFHSVWIPSPPIV